MCRSKMWDVDPNTLISMNEWRATIATSSSLRFMKIHWIGEYLIFISRKIILNCLSCSIPIEKNLIKCRQRIHQQDLRTNKIRVIIESSKKTSGTCNLMLMLHMQRCEQGQIGVGRYASSSSHKTFKAVKKSETERESCFNRKISHCNSETPWKKCSLSSFQTSISFSRKTMLCAIESSTEFMIQECTSILQRFHALKLGLNSVRTGIDPSTKSNLFSPSYALCIECAHEWKLELVRTGVIATEEGPLDWWMW